MKARIDTKFNEYARALPWRQLAEGSRKDMLRALAEQNDHGAFIHGPAAGRLAKATLDAMCVAECAA